MRKLDPLPKTHKYFREQKVQVSFIFFLENCKHNSFIKMSVWKRNFSYSTLALENIKWLSAGVDKSVAMHWVILKKLHF